MLGNFSYVNPTKLYFGEDFLSYLNQELSKYGKNVMLVYGGGSIKKNGIYEQVVEILKAEGKNIVEDAGVMPNPTVEKLHEGCRIAKEAKGKATDWMVHMIGQAVGAYTDATHGMTLSAVSIPYYRYIMNEGLSKFKRYAVNVWNINPEGKSDAQTAKEGLYAMETYMKEIGVVMKLSELGVTEEMIPGIVKSTLIMDGGYKVLTAEDIETILRQSM